MGRRRNSSSKVFHNQVVYFLDTKHGFWRKGTCYKEDKKHCMCRDINDRGRYNVPLIEGRTTIELWSAVEERQGKPDAKDTR